MNMFCRFLKLEIIFKMDFVAEFNMWIRTYLHYSSKSKEGSLKILGAIYTKDVVHYSKKLLHGLCVLDMDLFDQSIQTHASSTTYLGGICKQTEVAGGLH